MIKELSVFWRSCFFLVNILFIFMMHTAFAESAKKDKDVLEQELKSIFAQVEKEQPAQDVDSIDSLIALSAIEPFAVDSSADNTITASVEKEGAQPLHTSAIALGSTNLPLPRFVTLGAKEVNVRNGPGLEHAINWRFVKKGLPVEIISEFENWRQIRDAYGEDGWVLHSLLSSQRNALTRPWDRDKKQYDILHSSPSENAKPIAKIEPNVMVTVEKCAQQWCEVKTKDYEGWVQRDILWGVYPDEDIQ